MPQPIWFNETVYQRVRQLSLIANPIYIVFAPWALSDEYIRLIGGKKLFCFSKKFSDAVV